MDKIWLRALEPDDYKYTHQWRTDDATWSSVAGTKRFVSLDTERRWLINALESHEKGDVLRFVICVGESEIPVGMISANSIDHINKTCEISRMIAPESRGLGIVKKAMILVYDYLYSQLGVNRIESRVLEDNIASIRSQEKFGSVQEGVLRKAIFKDGKFKDLICFAMLREEFYELYSEIIACDNR